MNVKTHVFRLVFVFLFSTLVAIAPATAQGDMEGRKAVDSENKPQPAPSPANDVGDGKHEVEPPEAMRLKSEIDALREIVKAQEQTLNTLQKRLGELEARGNLPAADDVNKAATTGPAIVTVPLPPGITQSPTDKPTGLAGWENNHAFIRSADGKLEINLAGYGQLDYRGYQEGDHPPNTFVVRRARLAVEGNFYKYFDWRIEGDFADTLSTPLRDFYLNIQRFDEFQVRFGQTREPFSQEEIRSDAVQDFVERSLVNNLTPSRSPGVLIHGSIGDGQFEYQAGVFNGKGLLTNNSNGTPDSALRLRFNPFKDSDNFWTKGLIFGGAYNQGRNLNNLSVRGQTESRIIFFAPELVNGNLFRANGELTWLLGPATIRAEYDQVNQRRDNLGPNETNLPGLVGKGYMAQFTYLLTGEAKSDAGVLAPKKSFLGTDGESGWGAWELKLRYSNLQLDDRSPRSNRADTIYFGTNWYMNRFVRYLLDFGIERFKDPARSPRPGENFFTVLSRIQVAF